MSKFKVGDVFWFPEMYALRGLCWDDRELYVRSGDDVVLIFATKKDHPGCYGHRYTMRQISNNTSARHLDDELTDNEQVNYALAMMGLLEESN